VARYSPSNVPISPELSDTQRWLREETEQIRNSTDDIYGWANFAREQFVIAGYGSVGLDAVTPFGDIGATWQTLPFDITLVDPPKGVVYTLGDQGIVWLSSGVWRINAKISVEFVEAQNGRRIQLRLFNATGGGGQGLVFTYSVGRNTDGVNLNLSLSVQLSSGAVGDIFVLQVSSDADTFTGVQLIGSTWDTNYISEWQGEAIISTILEE
jgi:hypothetical protein